MRAALDYPTVFHDNDFRIVKGTHMAFNFEKFTDTKASFAAKVTVRRTGQLGLNAGALNSFRIKDYTYAVLYFDPDERVVGIEMTNENGLGAIEIKKSETNTFIRARNFCDRYGIDYSDSKSYRLLRDNETGFLFFHLEDAEPKAEQGEAAAAAGEEEEATTP